MKKIALLYSYQDIIGQTNHREAVKLFVQGPDNIGNLVYLTVIENLFDHIDLVSAQEVVNRGADIAEEYSTLLLPFSNMLSPYFTSNIIDSIIEHHIPITLFSIGVQLPLGDDASEMRLSADSERLLRYAGASPVPIGVRGEISQRVLQRYGIESTIVGCPTFSSVGALRPINGENFLINATLSGHHRQLTSDMLDFGRMNDFGYALQDETRIIADIYKFTKDDLADPHSVHSQCFSNLLFDYGYYNNDSETWGSARDWFQRKAFFETTYHSWSSRLLSFDFVIGMRVHGNAIAMLNGIPAIFVPCDQRTFELCQYHSLPSVERVTPGTDPISLAAAANNDAFFEQQRNTKSTLNEYWERAGLASYLKS